MDTAMNRKQRFSLFGRSIRKSHSGVPSIANGKINVPYIVKEIRTEDQEMKDFLFTLGCYVGEEVTIISRLADNVVISVKDARYSINSELAKVIIVS